MLAQNLSGRRFSGQRFSGQRWVEQNFVDCFPVPWSALDWLARDLAGFGCDLADYSFEVNNGLLEIVARVGGQIFAVQTFVDRTFRGETIAACGSFVEIHVPVAFDLVRSLLASWIQSISRIG